MFFEQYGASSVYISGYCISIVDCLSKTEWKVLLNLRHFIRFVYVCLHHTMATTISRSLEFQKVAANFPVWGITPNTSLHSELTLLGVLHGASLWLCFFEWAGELATPVPSQLTAKNKSAVESNFYLQVLHGCCGFRVVFSSSAFPL